MRRRVRIPVSYVVFDHWLTGQWRRAESDVPADLRVVGVTDDPYRGLAYLHCESTAFDEIPEIADPPEWTPTFRSVEVPA